MAMSTTFESWLEGKINRIKSQGGLRYFGRRESDDSDTETSKTSINMEAHGQTSEVNSKPFSPGSSDNYYKFAWGQGEEHNPQARTSNHTNIGNYGQLNTQSKFGMKQPTNYYSITDIIDDESENDEFELDPNIKFEGGKTDFDVQTWSFEDDFKPQAEDLGVGGEFVFGERGLGDGNSQPESAFMDPAKNPQNLSPERNQMGNLSLSTSPSKDFDQQPASTDVKFISGQYGGHPAVIQPASPVPMNTGGAILPMDGLHDLSMDELDSVDSRDVEERSEMLDPELDRCESIDLDDERPIVTVDQATLLEQWRQKSKQIKLAMLSTGLVLVIALVALTIYLIIHFH